MTRFPGPRRRRRPWSASASIPPSRSSPPLPSRGSSPGVCPGLHPRLLCRAHRRAAVSAGPVSTGPGRPGSMQAGERPDDEGRSVMPNPRTSWTSVLCDSLEKVFPDADPRPMDTGITQHVFAGETIAVQVALKPPTQRAGRPPEVDVEVVTGPGITATLSSVDLVPASFLAFDEHDDGYLRDTAGLYPDPLRPMPEPRIRAFIGQWRAVWIDLCADDDVSDGTVPIRITLRSD